MQTLDQALEAQKNGQFKEAEDLYRKIISTEPTNFDALHMLGIVCCQNGKISEADKFFRAERWSHFLTQPAKVDSPMQRMTHHEDAETVFG